MKLNIYSIFILFAAFVLPDIAASQSCGGVCAGFRTQTQGGWGAKPNGGNPGVYLHENFSAAFPSGLTIGCSGRSVKLTTAQAITKVLPAGSGPALLPVGAQIDPASLNTVLAGQLISAKLNVGFDSYSASFGESSTSLKDLVFNSGTFSGKSVQFVIDEADKAIGSCGSSYSLSDLNDALDELNNNYDNGTSGKGDGEFDCPGIPLVVPPITGTLSACIGINTQLSNTVSGGVWSSSKTTVATVSNTGVVKGITAGTSVITYTISNSCGSEFKKASVTVKDCGEVDGGGEGGLESKSLGDAVGNRLLNKAVNSLQGTVNYARLPVFKSGLIRSNATGTGTNLSLTDLLPQQIAGNTMKALVSTPKDITAITNAKDVLSIDYTINNEAKAVAFATKTIGEVYDHTKAVCDRLKGSELTGLQNIMVNNTKLVRYDLKTTSGQMEYAISFIIGAGKGRDTYTIQSNWLNDNYITDDVMFNIQLWAVSPSIVESMAADIIGRLNSTMPVKEIISKTDIPKIYITRGKRVSENIIMDIKNESTYTNGYFAIQEKVNEQSAYTTKQVPFTIAANGNGTINLPAGDSYESTIKMYVNGSLQDQVFMSDGNWGVDYNTATSSVKNFKIINNTSAVVDNKDDFLLFRNVRVEANSPDYITLYKMLRGGGAKQDLTAFKTLQFSASGSGAVMKVVLLKAGITNWADQYTIEIPLTAAKKDYQLSLNDFVSAGSNVKINPNDLTAIIFSLPVSSGKMTAVSADISSVLFSKVDYAYVNSLNSKEIITYPNPSSGKFNVNFKSAVSNELRVFITEVTTGRVVYSKQVWAQIGENSVPVIINNVKGLSNYIISVEGAGNRYTPRTIIIDQH